MQKIPSLFVRNYEGDRKVRDEVVPGSEWVLAGEGIATRKWDGKAVLVMYGQTYKRYDCKKGRTPPEKFMPCTPEPDPVTGHWPGWVAGCLFTGDLNIEAAHARYLKDHNLTEMPDGTYELCGPSVGTRHGPNPENLEADILIPHGKDLLEGIELTFDGIKNYLKDSNIEGIVWYHPDGRMVKIKKKDFDYRLVTPVSLDKLTMKAEYNHSQFAPTPVKEPRQQPDGSIVWVNARNEDGSIKWHHTKDTKGEHPLGDERLSIELKNSGMELVIKRPPHPSLYDTSFEDISSGAAIPKSPYLYYTTEEEESIVSKLPEMKQSEFGVVVDIETLSTDRKAIVFNVAAHFFAFDVNRMDEMCNRLNMLPFINMRLGVMDQIRLGRIVDEDTLKFWKHPNRAAAWDAIQELPETNTAYGIREFRNWLNMGRSILNARIYYRGIDFDGPTLNSLYEDLGMTTEWKRGDKPRDVGSIIDGVTGGVRGYLPGVTENLLEHTSMGDVVRDIRQLQFCWKHYGPLHL